MSQTALADPDIMLAEAMALSAGKTRATLRRLKLVDTLNAPKPAAFGKGPGRPRKDLGITDGEFAALWASGVRAIDIAAKIGCTRCNVYDRARSLKLPALGR